MPGWWAYDALKGWIAKVAVEMNERRFKNQLEGPPAKKKKKVKMQAAATGMIPLKHCHFVTTIRSTPGLASIIPLIDLLPAPKQPKSDSATDLQAWDLKSELLFGALYRDLGLGEGDRLVYTVTGVRGEKIDVGVGVGDDGGLRRAAMCLRRVGETGLFLEVIRSVSIAIHKFMCLGEKKLTASSTQDDDIFTEHFDRYETPQPVPTLRTETPEVDIAQRIEPVIQTHLHSKESTPTIKREPDAEETIDLDLSSASNSPVSILKRRWDKDDENLVAESVDDEIAGLVGSEIRVPYSFSRRREASRRLQ